MDRWQVLGYITVVVILILITASAISFIYPWSVTLSRL